MQMATQPVLLNRAEAAAYISRTHFRCTPRRLAQLASEGGGPAYRRHMNSRALYEQAELDAWALSSLSPPIRVACERPIAGRGEVSTWH